MRCKEIIARNFDHLIAIGEFCRQDVQTPVLENAMYFTEMLAKIVVLANMLKRATRVTKVKSVVGEFQMPHVHTQTEQFGVVHCPRLLGLNKLIRIVSTYSAPGGLRLIEIRRHEAFDVRSDGVE